MRPPNLRDYPRNNGPQLHFRLSAIEGRPFTKRTVAMLSWFLLSGDDILASILWSTIRNHYICQVELTTQ